MYCFLLYFSPRIVSSLRSCIKNSKECFSRFPDTSKLVKKVATCSVWKVLHGWSRGQTNEQQNNAPNPKNNAAAGYQGPVKIELLKGACLLDKKKKKSAVSRFQALSFLFQSPILNIDIAPTIVELGGGKAPQSMDGRSILPLLVGC